MLPRPTTLVALLIASVSTLASAQSANLLKNPSGDEGSQYWRAFGNANVEQCLNGGGCFVLRDGGYFIQDVAIPEEAVGQYALLMGRGSSERPNRDGTINGMPSLYGYMMNVGDPRGGRIYANLDGQQMRGTGEHSAKWTTLWGIFRVKLGTGRISFFLRQGAPNGGSATRFDDLGLYIFPTEQQARAALGIQFTPTQPLATRPICKFSQKTIPALYGIQLGMSVEEIVTLFPGSVEDARIQEALESSKASNAPPLTRILIENKTNKQELSEVKRIFFQFSSGRLFSFNVDYRAPQWNSADQFIDKRGQLLNLSGADSWEAVEGNSKFSKYLICDGIEIRFYAAPIGSGNNNYVSLTDTRVEKELFNGGKGSSDDFRKPTEQTTSAAGNSSPPRFDH